MSNEETTRAILRAAANIIDTYGVPTDYESALRVVAITYAQAGTDAWQEIRDKLRGDEERDAA